MTRPTWLTDSQCGRPLPVSDADRRLRVTGRYCIRRKGHPKQCSSDVREI